MIFSKLFKKNKKIKKESFDDYSQGEYSVLQTEHIVDELQLPQKTREKNYVLDLCEQMIQTAKDMEDAKAEYKLVTNYLTDIQTIEDLADEEKAPLSECASHVAKLEKQRTEFLKTEQRLSDAQYVQMQDEEPELPGIIKRLKANEEYLDVIKKDMAYLEGKKLECSMKKSENTRIHKVMQRAAVYLFLVVATVMIFLFVLSWYMEKDLKLPITIIGLLAVLSGAFILYRYQKTVWQIKQADVNRNHVITLENQTKIKYVNIKNAVNYVCDRFHVRNSYELEYLYEQYQEEVREKEQFRQTSEELSRYSEELLDLLAKLRMYDSRVWINHAYAIVDSRELVELKHDLITRRQKIRVRMESAVRSLSEMKEEAMKNVDKMGEQAPHVIEIIQKIDGISEQL